MRRVRGPLTWCLLVQLFFILSVQSPAYAAALPANDDFTGFADLILTNRSDSLVSNPVNDPVADAVVAGMDWNGLAVDGGVGSGEVALTDYLSDLRTAVANLPDESVRFSHHQIDVMLSSISLSKDGVSATVVLDEMATYFIEKVNGNEPDYAQERNRREWRFVNLVSGWKLVSMSVSSQGGSPLTDHPQPVVEPLEPDEDPNLEQFDPGPPISEPKGVVQMAVSNGTEGSASTLAYNYQAMANYALTYVFNYNSNYKTHPGNDCTNFISQALHAGGWPEARAHTCRTCDSAWWYFHIVGNPTSLEYASYPWTSVRYWYRFALTSGRTRLLSSRFYLGLADVVQVDWTNDGRLDHTMMVTRVVDSSRYVTYHSHDRKNLPLAFLRQQYPSASWRYHRT